MPPTHAPKPLTVKANRVKRPWLAFAVLTSVISLLSALFFFGFSIDWRTNPSPLVGKPAPGFVASNLKNGTTLTAKRLQGKPYVLNFWASWCLPCRQEASILETAHQRYEKQQQKVRILGIAVQTTKADALGFVQKFGKTYFTALDSVEGGMAVNYGLYGVPETFFVDAKGIIRHKHVGPLTTKILAQNIEQLLE